MNHRFYKAVGGVVVCAIGLLTGNQELVVTGLTMVAVPSTDKVFDTAVDGLRALRGRD